MARPVVRIRPFREDDYPALVVVTNVVHPDYPRTEEEVRHGDSRFQGRFRLHRLVAEEGGRLVGWAEFHHQVSEFHPRKFFVDLGVHPDFQGQGIGARLYEALLQELEPLGPLVLWAGARETSARGVRFLLDRGFVERQRTWESRLEVAAFDPTPFQAKAEEAVRELRVTTVAEERERDPKWKMKLYDLDIEVGADIPRMGDYTPPGLEDWKAGLLENPNWIPEADFVVVDGDRYVAHSNLFRSQQLPDVLYQGITGTRRAYRGRGLALALKLRTVAYAKTHGYREIRTWNDALNAPMLHINERLGFVRQPAWVGFEKVLKEGGS
jgi:GNAT superfamily N-acetyltransferase